jgi:kynureninase
VSAHLLAWATKAVTGHLVGHEDSLLPPFLNLDDFAAEKMASIVGALTSEVAVMETLTANLHLLMASFYRPSKEKYKVILEGKAFPSDHVCILLDFLTSHLILLCSQLAVCNTISDPPS